VNRAANFLGMGCAFFALCATCLASFSCYALLPTPARDAAQGFLADVRARDWPSALRRTSSDYQRAHDQYALQQAVSRIPRLDQHTGSVFYNATMESDGAQLDGTLSTPDGDIPIGVELVEVDGYWYVDHLVVQGVPLE
jgi:hypothetical protein